MASDGPLGAIPGMIFDPIRNKYFAAAAAQPPRPLTLQRELPTSGTQRVAQPASRLGHDGVPVVQSRKRNRVSATQSESLCTYRKPLDAAAGPSDSGLKPRRLRPRLVPTRRSRAKFVATARSQVQYCADMELERSVKLVDKPCERITSLTTWSEDSVYVTTDHGRVFAKRPDHNYGLYIVCESPLLGIHANLPRNTFMTVSSGPHPHIHRTRFGTEDCTLPAENDEAELRVKDAYASSSHGDLLTIGCNKRLITVDSGSDNMEKWHARRRLQSDPLAVHHADKNIIYAGLRNSQVLMVDKRTDGRELCSVVGQTVRGKAVVGVRRLKDFTVPFGLVASGMASELLLFDIRYGKSPLRTLPGHVNTCYPDLGLTTTTDDQILFAAGSDRRIRAWNLLDGSRLLPAESDPSLLSTTSSNPLTRIFEERPSGIQFSESGLLDVAVAKSVYRFSRPTIVTHHPMTAEPYGPSLS